MDGQAIILFVGLVMFTTQAGTLTTRTTGPLAMRATNGVIAIMPAVRSGGTVATQKEASTLRVSSRKIGGRLSATQANVSLEAVEDHTTRIIFESWARTGPAVGWVVKQLNPDPTNNLSNFDYIELNNDRVRFIVDRPNGQATVPPQLRHAGGTLQAGYGPPYYTAAAAVFDIPVGALAACTSKSLGTNGRLDTELRLNTSGTITIKTDTKSLTLNTDAVIYVVNVPEPYARAHDLEHTARNHFLVYCRMVGITDANCNLPRAEDQGSCKDCLGDVLKPPRPDDTNANRNARRSSPPKGARGVRPTIPPIVAIASFECSNSQYP